MIDLLGRYQGALLGLACGDAVGTTVEFCSRGSFTPVSDMVGGGPFALQAGQWTDDTSMALCLAESLVEKKEFNPQHQMAKYLNWWRWGYWSSTGECFDIGMTTRNALQRYADNGDPFAGSVNPNEAGNGSLMRLVPVVLFAFPQLDKCVQLAADSSRTTHGAAEAVDACRLFAVVLYNALQGATKENILEGALDYVSEEKIKALANAEYLKKDITQIKGSGYVVESLEAALWCFAKSDSYQSAVLMAANLGDDADTTAAIVGQIVGAYYGVAAIPQKWLDILSYKNDIQDMATRLYQLR